MAERRKIIWDFVADTSGLKRGSREASRDLAGVEKASDGASRGLGSMGKAAIGVGSAIGAAAFADFALDAGELARKGDVLAGSFNTVFDNADRLRKSLDEVRTSSGLSKIEFDELLLPLGQLIGNMGIAGGAANNFVTQLTTKAGDVAAFRGDLSLTDDVLASFGSALKGEFDPLEQWGFKIKQADVNQRALLDTGKDTTAALTDQEKTIAILNLIMGQNVEVTGAMEDAQGSLQDSINDANAAAEDAKATFGGWVNTFLIGSKQIVDFVDREWDRAWDNLTFASDEATRAMGQNMGKTATDVETLAAAAEESMSRWAMANQGVQDSVAPQEFVRKVEMLAKASEDAALRIVPAWAEVLGVVASTRGELDNLAPAFERVGRRVVEINARGQEPQRFSHSGGVVPGIGPKTMTLLGGERVIPRGSADTGGGTVVNVYIGVAGDPDAVAREVVGLIDRYERVNGPRASGLPFGG